MNNKKVRVEARVDPELKAAVEEVLKNKYFEMSMTEYLTKCLEFTKQFEEVPNMCIIYQINSLLKTVEYRDNTIKDLKQELSELKSKQRGGWFNSAREMCSWLGGK